jgi:DNA-binding MarR family transcriptional regulator
MDVPGRLILNLRDLGHIVRLLYEGKGSQTGILIRLKEEGTMTQSQLTEKLGIQPGSASEVLGKLEAAGLILRTPNPEDRRTADIRLTPEGQTQAEAAADRRQMRHEEMFQGLTQAEQETLLELLERLNRQWTETYGNRKHQERPHHGRGHHRHG